MRRHADLRRREIEGGLYHDDHEDICQALLRVRRMTMAQQKSRPRADDPHYASRRADELKHLDKTDYGQEHYARARGEP